MNKIVKLIQYFILAEGVYILYLTVLSVLKTFYPEPSFIIIHSLFGLSGLAAIIISFGLRSKKNWAIISYGIFIILISLFPKFGINNILSFHSVYTVLTANFAAVIYLMTTQLLQWKSDGNKVD